MLCYVVLCLCCVVSQCCVGIVLFSFLLSCLVLPCAMLGLVLCYVVLFRSALFCLFYSLVEEHFFALNSHQNKNQVLVTSFGSFG
jgi:hypothetical protein